MNEHMKALILSALAAMSLSLVACGGGGGGGPIPTPIQTQTPAHGVATFAGGFEGGSGSSAQSSQTRRAMDVSPVLTGAILPFAVFALPDATVQNTSGIGTLGYTAVAYLDTSNGSTLPATLPTVAFTETGNNIPLGQVLAVPTPDPTKKKNIIGAQDLGQPTTIGQTVITASATGGFGSINLTANTYYGLALNVQNPGTFTPPAGNLSSVSFDANGKAYEDGGANGAPDLTITLDSNGVPTLNAPNGIMVESEGITTATAAQFSKASAATSVKGNGVCLNGSQSNGPQVTTYLIGTKAGGVVAWEADDSNGGSMGWSDNNCDWVNAYGPYTKLQ